MFMHIKCIDKYRVHNYTYGWCSEWKPVYMFTYMFVIAFKVVVIDINSTEVSHLSSHSALSPPVPPAAGVVNNESTVGKLKIFLTA